MSLAEWIKGLAGASVVCCVALTLTPEGRARTVLKLVCGCCMALALLAPLTELDMDAYAADMASYREEAAAVAADAEETAARLTRTIIERECSAYILDKAAGMGAELISARTEARWSAEQSCWYPFEVYITSESYSGELARDIEAELGVPGERQHWESAYEG